MIPGTDPGEGDEAPLPKVEDDPRTISPEEQSGATRVRTPVAVGISDLVFLMEGVVGIILHFHPVYQKFKYSHFNQLDNERSEQSTQEFPSTCLHYY